MFDRLVGDAADLLDNHPGKARCRLRVNHHHAVITDDDPCIRVAFRGESPQIAANFSKADFLLAKVTL